MKVITLQQIEQSNCSVSEIAEAISQAFTAALSGDIVWKPKSMIGGPDGTFLMSTFCSWPARNLNLFHSLIGSTYDSQSKGAAAYRSVQLLTAYDNAEPIALIEGAYTSRMLPAGVTRLMTGRLAVSKERVATFVGAGTQARVNLGALDGAFPIDEVRIISRTRQSAEKFARYVTERGQKAVIMDAGPEAMDGADIIVTTVPANRDLQPFLDPAWVRPGTFVNAVDLGRSWKQGFAKFDYRMIDDRAQAIAQAEEGRLAHGGPFDSEIAEIIAGSRPGRTGPDQRIVLIHPGNVVGVMGVTSLLHGLLVADC